MTQYIIGFSLGAAFTYIVLVVVKAIKAKSGIKYAEYKTLPLLVKLKDVLRHIIYEYSIKKNNEDFLLNVLHKGVPILQIMHRAHFPYLAKDNPKPNFGMVIYIPISKLTESQRACLERILIEESDNYQKESVPFDYHVVDLGKGLKHGGYLITRIMKEVFKFELEEANFDFKLFSDGKLPYYGKKHGFQITPN